MKQMVNGECQVLFFITRKHETKENSSRNCAKSAISLTLSIAQRRKRRKTSCETSSEKINNYKKSIKINLHRK